MHRPPAGIYFVAPAFFVSGILCTMQLASAAFAAVGLPGALNLATLNWILPGYVLALILVCYGTALLTRLNAFAVWAMFGMTLFLVVQAITAPAVSPFYTAPRIYLNRIVLMLPMIASCVYLGVLRFRAAPR